MALTTGQLADGPKPVADGRLAYRPAELAAMVGLSTKAIYRAIERGELAAAKVANRTRLLIPAQAAESWLASNSVTPRAAQKPRGRRQSHPAVRPLGEALQRISGLASEE